MQKLGNISLLIFSTPQKKANGSAVKWSGKMKKREKRIKQWNNLIIRRYAASGKGNKYPYLVDTPTGSSTWKDLRCAKPGRTVARGCRWSKIIDIRDISLGVMRFFGGPGAAPGSAFVPRAPCYPRKMIQRHSISRGSRPQPIQASQEPK